VDPDGAEWEVYHLNYDLEDEIPMTTARPVSLGLPMAKAAGAAAPDKGDPSWPARHQGNGEGQVRTGRASRGVRRGARPAGGTASSREGADPITSNLYAETQTCGLPRSGGGVARVRQPDRARPAPGRRDRAGPRLRGRYRRAALGPARRPHRQGLWARHDDEMLALARENQKKAGLANVEFLKARSSRSRCPTTRWT